MLTSCCSPLLDVVFEMGVAFHFKLEVVVGVAFEGFEDDLKEIFPPVLFECCSMSFYDLEEWGTGGSVEVKNAVV